MTKTIKSTFFYAGAIALCVPPVFVFVWMILTGLKTGVQNISYPPEFIFRPTLENFRAVFQQYNFFRYLMNSLIVAGLATGISLLLGLPAAYSIAKYRQGKIGILILVARMTPFVSYLLPWYIIFRHLKLIDTYTALTVTHLIITLPMVIWLADRAKSTATIIRMFLMLSHPLRAKRALECGSLRPLCGEAQFRT